MGGWTRPSVAIWMASLFVALAAPGKDEGGPRLMVVSGTTLESPALNFRLKAPEGWSWREDPELAEPKNSQVAFRAVLDAYTSMIVVVGGRNRYTLSERDALNNAMSLVRKAADPGAHSNLFSVAPRPTRFGVASNFSYTEDARTVSGHPLCADGVLFAADRLYGLLYVSEFRDHLGEFNSMARSFELIHEVVPGDQAAAPPSTPSAGWGKATGTLLLVAVGLVGAVRIVLAVMRRSA